MEKRTFLRPSTALGALLVGAFHVQCSDPAPSGSCTSDMQCSANQRCVSNRCVSSDGGGSTDGSMDASPRDTGMVLTDARRESGPRLSITGLQVTPGSMTLTSTNGSQPTQTFTAQFLWSDGTMAPAMGGLWSIDSPALGDIDSSSGVFTANGLAGGSVTVTVRVANPDTGDTLMATATLAVNVSRTILAPGVPAEVPTHFGTVVPAATAGMRSASIAYPLDGVVMPQNVYPTDIQWLNGAAGDEFRITLTKPHATVTAYLVAGAGFTNHYLPDLTAWRAFAQTDGDTAATLTVDRYTGGMAYASAPVTLTFARAAINGSVYYWDIAAGHIVRIDDGTATRNQFMPTPPVDATGTQRCVGCHSVSPNGRYMAGRLGGGENIGGVFDLTTDLTGNNPPTTWPLVRGPTSTPTSTSARWWFSTWSPDSRRLAVTWADGPMGYIRLLDPFTGQFLPTTGTALPTAATHPSWAPDNSAVAVVSAINAWGGDNATGNISVVPVTGADSFGDLRTLHMGASLAGNAEHGNADAYPTWSPDSRRIAFAHGTTSRSESGSSALYIMGADGTNVLRLDRANGGLTNNFQPRFAPFSGSQWFWLSFLSKRDYGNSQAGTRGANRQQIWVTAIRLPRPEDPPNRDPSSVPYWLPGQAITSQNIAAYWAPRPCRSMGEGCSVGGERCSGDCSAPSSGGAPVCSPPRMMQCRQMGQTCDTTSDCCMGMGLNCIDHVCAVNPG